MGTRKVSDKLKDKVGRLFEKAARADVIKALEAGKTVYVGPHKLKGEEIKAEAEGKDGGAAPPSAPPSDNASAASSGRGGRDK
jgi:hypothetical protein